MVAFAQSPPAAPNESRHKRNTLRGGEVNLAADAKGQPRNIAARAAGQGCGTSVPVFYSARR
ncbi:hypothetical protein Thiowin_03518 [Thiorhodovibrio winogradskyi]|uniref:Uncharacterized protein n=1 Tax=Thiorhodovibrio winogradskyi TaxID=77007 RepID=A0ABZ0SFP9_9GAMM